MSTQGYTTSFVVNQTPEEAFSAINNVRGWWSGEIEGPTSKLGDEFTYRYKDVHYSKQRIVEVVPGKRIVWLILEAWLSFIEDKNEWNGTKVVFEVSKKGDETEVRFTHEGLVPQHECFDKCSNAWRFRHLSDKQENNRDGFVAVVGLTVQNLVQHQGRIRPLNRAGSLDLYGKVGPSNPTDQSVRWGERPLFLPLIRP